MAKQELDIIIKATNEAGPELKKVNDELDDVKKNATGAQKGFKSLNSSLQKAQAAMGALAGVTAVIGATFAFAKNGESIKKVAGTFDALSESVGASADFMDRLEVATGKAVSNVELMKGANKVLGLQLAGTDDEAVKLIETAVKLGSAFEDDASTSIENFSLLLANQSIPRLDSFGISSSKVRERMAELTTGVGALDKETAFMQATMEEAEKAITRLGLEGDTAASSITRAEVHFKNFADSLAVTVADGIVPYLDGITSIAAANQKLDRSIEENTNHVIDTVKNYGEYQDVIALSVVEVNKLTEAEFNLTKAQREREVFFAITSKLNRERMQQTQDLVQAEKDLASAAETAAEDIEMAELRKASSIEASMKARDAQVMRQEEQAVLNAEIVRQTIADRQALATEGRRIFQEEVAQINAIIEARQIQLGTAAAGALERSQSTWQAIQADRTLKDELLNQAAALGISNTQFVLGAEAVGIYTESQIRAALEAAAMEEKVRELAAGIADGSVNIQDAFAQLDAFEKKLKETGDSAIQLASDLDTLPSNIPINVEFTQTGEISIPSDTGGGRIEIQSRAHGGPFHAGPLLVGERGPELLFPSSGGTVINNQQTRQMLGGTNNITINVNSPMMATPEAIANTVSNEIGRRMRG